MELRQLKYFVATVDHGSISRAAVALHVAQPALSHQIQLLEQGLGGLLLHRTRQGVLSTDAGKKFYAHAQAILKQVLDAKSSVGQAGGRLSGTVALGIPQSVSAALALPLLKAVHSTYPDITLQLTEELTGNLVEPLRSGRLNLAILFDDGQLDEFVVSRLVKEELMYISAATSVYRPQHESINFSAAICNRLILPGIQHGVRPLIEATARAAGQVLTQVIEINSVAILKSALLADIGATLIPPAPLAAELRNRELVAVPVAEPHLIRTLALCSSKAIPLTDSARAIHELIMTLVDELCNEQSWIGARSYREHDGNPAKVRTERGPAPKIAG
ncbi:LysR substrate-binding domain-containing protein [Burkholderia cepacia]|uniref:LysR substrate-binding domain-containing protein n=1 Tax=Burkholderia cepacia TaxID=292 RepID=UPI001F3893E2|nr:LysR substrate-binding domain-containing protein [Burkholderia cepacia]MCE4124412.1 LysR substrate-binding domain-containing protein [Burkholderia cepacia]